MKLHCLEAVRGIASWVVLLSHFSLGFLPVALGLAGSQGQGGLAGTPLFFLFNGKAAVYVFFVLSGYVLTYRHFGTPSLRALVIGMIKRWPRLAGPVLVTVLAAMALFAFGAYSNQEAAQLTDSTWLADGVRTPVGNGFEPSWAGAVTDALFRTFFGGGSRYNTNLWTMRVELFGSYLAWMLAIGLGATRNRAVALVALPILVSWLSLLSGLCAAFAAGVGLAYLHAQGIFASHRLRTSVLLILAAALLLSLYGPQGWLAPLKPYDLPWHRIKPCAYTLGSLLLIHAILCSDFLRQQGGGMLGRWLGRLSFPVYLVHALVLASFSSWLFMALQAWPAALALAATFAATVALVLTAALPLAWFDEWWTRFVTRAATAAYERLAARAPRLAAWARSARPMADGQPT